MKIRFFLVFLGVLTPLLAAAPAAFAQSEIPTTIAYQGYLTNTAGDPANGIIGVTFRLYDSPSGGAALWKEPQQDVLFTDGVFSVHLGSVVSLEEVPFGGALWLGVTVGSQELAPRTALEAVPYALSVRGLSVTLGVDEDYGVVPNLVGGYAGNQIEGDEVAGATINGGGGEGVENVITHSFGTIGGGYGNRITGTGATVGGGRRNEALGCYDTVAGGERNRAQTEAFGAAFKSAGMSCNATVGGGRDNVASADGATVAGGVGNTASRSSATVGGGTNNRVSGSRATVGGGRDNTATEFGATVPGGQNNHARGVNSLAAGFSARAAHDGAFVWSDNAGSFSDSLVSTAEHQFLIRATGGVGIGTNAPQGALHVTNTESNLDLVLGGTDNSLFGDDGVIASDPAYPSSDLWFVSNDGVLVVLDADESAESSEFIVADADLDLLLQVDGFGVTRTNRIEVQQDLEPGTAPAEGGVYRDNVVYAWAHVNLDGSVVSSFGCTVTRTGTGTYTISYESTLGDGAAPIVSPLSANDPVIAAISLSSPTGASVKINGFVGGLFQTQDRPFFFQVVGRP